MNQPINQSINQPINQSTNQQIDEQKKLLAEIGVSALTKSSLFYLITHTQYLHII